jgi:AhpD family alkylhydroperoxidase
MTETSSLFSKKYIGCWCTGTPPFSGLIHYRGIIHERTEDAPFMGALIIAATCDNGCKDCFNQHLKEARVYTRTAEEIIEEVRQNPFNDGIILGGLEWSQQPREAIELIRCAAASGLQVILYTGLTERELYDRIPKEHLVGCLVKFGKYDSTLASDTYKSYNVHLASTNQYIKQIS